jgi:hypothetical protein
MSSDTGSTPGRTLARSGSAGVSAAAERLGFWTAVAFPAVYVGIAALRSWIPAFGAVVVALLVVNAAALLVGHSHKIDRREPTDRDG